MQSDWGQKGKKEGFEQISNADRKYLSDFQKRWDITDDSGGDLTKLQDEYVNWLKSKGFPQDLSVEDLISDKGNIPLAPFVTDTNSWTKLGLKVALKEAVAQGAERIAWSSGEQQFDRWGSEKISWKKEVIKLNLNKRLKRQKTTIFQEQR